MGDANTDAGNVPANMGDQFTVAPTVLIVDDENINLLVLKGMLTAAGFDTLQAPDGPQGRDIARRVQPDIILLDIMMPGENGFETCRQLKNDPLTTDIPIIFISALTDVDNKVRGLEMGAVDYITKPFEKAEVMARIRLHLKLQFAQKAIIEEQATKLKRLTEAQQAILVDPAQIPEARFAIEYVPVLEAGGDFYDVFQAGKRTWCYFVADICGHDLGASFVTSSLKALLRQNAGPLYTPLETMKNINSVVVQILQDGRYLTAQSIYLNRGVSQAYVVNAGHPPAIYVDQSGKARMLQARGDILGSFETVCLEPLTQRVTQSDRLFMYTDGLTERFGPDRRSRVDGEGELLHYCEETRRMPVEEAVPTIIERLFNPSARREDDIVLMGIEV